MKLGEKMSPEAKIKAKATWAENRKDPTWRLHNLEKEAFDDRLEGFVPNKNRIETYGQTHANKLSDDTLSAIRGNENSLLEMFNLKRDNGKIMETKGDLNDDSAWERRLLGEIIKLMKPKKKEDYRRKYIPFVPRDLQVIEI